MAWMLALFLAKTWEIQKGRDCGRLEGSGVVCVPEAVRRLREPTGVPGAPSVDRGTQKTCSNLTRRCRGRVLRRAASGSAFGDMLVMQGCLTTQWRWGGAECG